MAKHVLKYTDAEDTVRIGSGFWDDPDSYDIWTYGGNDSMSLWSDGALWVNAGAGDDEIHVGGSGMATIYGGAGADFITHHENSIDDGVAKIYGGDGDDILTSYVNGEGDVLDGGAGNDRISLAKGNTGIGGSGDDTYDLFNIFDPYYSQNDVKIVEAANGGYDTVKANFSFFTFMPNIERYEALYTRDVKIYGNDQANSVTLSGGNDYAKMNGGDDDVYGGHGNDTILGDGGNDKMQGGMGDDFVEGGTGDDILMGGVDKWVRPGPNAADGYDKIYGGDGNDQLYGGGGSDYLNGGAGNDFLFGDRPGFGVDELAGGTGNDSYLVFGSERVVELSNQGIDTIQLIGPTYKMGANIENLVHGGHPGGNALDHQGSTNITGNELANSITGNSFANVVYGEAGADKIYGLGGNDQLYGGEHDDVLSGDTGVDLLYGDDGNDKAYGGDDNDTAYGGEGNDELAGNAGDDFLLGDAGNDTVFGGTGNDYIAGGAGYDNLGGEAGNDVIRGGTMNDYISGNGGHDRLHGDEGSDFLWGDAGADTFLYSSVKDSRIADGVDQIKDFERGVDKIDLSAIDANGLALGNQAFNWGGMAMPAPAAGNVWGQYLAANNYGPEYVRVYADVNGDGLADMSIDVMGQSSLTASDFIL